MREPVVPAEAGTQSATRSGYCFKVMLMGLGPSLRWDDEYLRFRAVIINELMVEKWNKSRYYDNNVAGTLARPRSTGFVVMYPKWYNVVNEYPDPYRRIRFMAEGSA
jgi:hypothetical protein